ncbi:hypothetical protein KIN20_009427 [Parelaphostrongylus tenuis]|uniref:Transmembrane protein n=1 Tax=Parelaphostrongylus tenuis TaxID=148309 RepID=A0AAD5MB53_PARTN|nr:hypothetical protein KIN20_009427 [Parelaphostrongylus tenuis]
MREFSRGIVCTVRSPFHYDKFYCRVTASTLKHNLISCSIVYLFMQPFVCLFIRLLLYLLVLFCRERRDRVVVMLVTARVEASSIPSTLRQSTKTRYRTPQRSCPLHCKETPQPLFYDVQEDEKRLEC